MTHAVKPRLLFLISRFLDGGIDTILVEYLRNIPLDRYDVTLAIGVKMDELEVHLPRIPAGVKVVYLVDNPVLTRWRKEKIRHRLPVAVKLYDEIVLNPIRKLTTRSRLDRLVSRADMVIDFDCTFYSLLQHSPVPVTGFYHFSIPENLSRWPRHTRRQMEGMRAYTHVALISNAMVEEGRRLFPELAAKFVRIYNGYNLDEFRRRGAAKLPADAPARYIVAVERLEESQKDITTLLDAYARALASQPDGGKDFPALVLVGEGRDRQRLEAHAKALGVGEKTFFAGFQPDAAPWIANAEALVHSSKYEGFGLVLAEALILGRPVVATDCPSGPAEVLDYGNAGILVPVGDADALAQAIARVAGSAALRSQMGEQALHRAATFDITESVNQLLSLCPIPTDQK